jgi:hypothetical protein
MKKNENADMIAKKRRVNAIDRTKAVPNMEFITKMKAPRNSPPFMDLSHLLLVLEIRMSGIWKRKIMVSAKMFVNMRAVAKSPMVRTNFARGSIL